MLISYEWWGSTASVVELVEKELSYSRAKIHQLEKRIEALESVQSSNAEADVAAARGLPLQKATAPTVAKVPQRSQNKP